MKIIVEGANLYHSHSSFASMVSHRQSKDTKMAENINYFISVPLNLSYHEKVCEFFSLRSGS